MDKFEFACNASSGKILDAPKKNLTVQNHKASSPTTLDVRFTLLNGRTVDDQPLSLNGSIRLTDSVVVRRIVILGPDGTEQTKFSVPAGTSLTGLTYILLNEFNKELDPAKIPKGITCSWTSTGDAKTIMAGRLPAVPGSERAQTTAFAVHYQKLDVQSQFEVQWLPGEPAAIDTRWSCPQQQCGAALSLAEGLMVTLQDQFQNAVLPADPLAVLPELTCEDATTPCNLGELQVEVDQANARYILYGLSFRTVGNYFLTVHWGQLQQPVAVRVMPGLAAKCKLVNHNSSFDGHMSTLKVIDGQRLAQPLQLQLLDAYDNPVADNYQVTLTWGKDLRVQPVDDMRRSMQKLKSQCKEDGRAIFPEELRVYSVDRDMSDHTVTVTARLGHAKVLLAFRVQVTPDATCPGHLQLLWPRVNEGAMDQAADSVQDNLSPLPDVVAVPANSTLPEITVEVRSQTQELLSDFDSTAQLMLQLQGGQQQHPSVTIPASEGKFQNVRVPRVAGGYKLTVSFRSLHYPQLAVETHLNVVPGPPARLKLLDAAGLAQPAVSNKANELLIISAPVTLALHDEFDNVLPTNPAFSGPLVAQVMPVDNASPDVIVPTVNLEPVASANFVEVFFCFDC